MKAFLTLYFPSFAILSAGITLYVYIITFYRKKPNKEIHMILCLWAETDNLKV